MPGGQRRKSPLKGVRGNGYNSVSNRRNRSLSDSSPSSGVPSLEIPVWCTDANSFDSVAVDDADHTGVAASRVDAPVYTGDIVIGLSAMHKSNIVPVTSSEQAKDIAGMRRTQK